MLRASKPLQKSRYSSTRNWLIYAIALTSTFMSCYAIYHISLQSTGSFVVEQYYQLQLPGRNIDFEQAINAADRDWVPTNTLVFPGSTEQVWIKFKPPIEASFQDSLIRVNDPLLDSFVVYFVHKEGSEKVITDPIAVGDAVSFSNRPVSLPSAIIPLPPNISDYTVYIQGSSNISINLEMSLWTVNDFLNFNDTVVLFIAILLGYVFALTCYSILMYSTTRQRGAFWFACFLISFSFHIVSLTSLGYQMLWTDNIGFQSVSATISACLSLGILAKFTLSIFNTIPKNYAQVVTGLIYLFGITILALLITRDVSIIKFAILLISVCGVVMFLLMLTLTIKKIENAKISTLIWAVIFVSVCVAVLDRLNFFTLPIQPIFPIIIGFYLQTQIMAVALIYRHKANIDAESNHRKIAIAEQAAAIKSKDEVVALKKNAQIELEKEVKAQTIQLEEVLVLLDKTGRELEQKTNVDGLTGLPNRYAFENKLDDFIDIANTKNIELHLALIDLDNFKKVNDTYGHMAGDDCLKAFAKILAEKFKNPEYIVCRYGGEEFALASIDSHSNVALALHQLKDAVQALKVQSHEHTISFTTSIGLSGALVSDQDEAKRLLAKADENLYQAKEDGRNLIVAKN
ncbi:diguanylate cyclase [Glaciecola sp. SC05]|uniref:sensor domain-containing diguanylate cyclase n=1 Tax=Glaciecola sp. SC05 TaxID=1987355 RepID=UPI00352815D1